ncbi:MAG: 4-hydroxy-tetrahydrodipicolinate synthase, partial [Holosporales bacterium]|nr:4-hydroxy-tetrahydrodipicolinate synthase [Holosporales bacterium]
AFEKYISYIVGSGISGIVVCGSTGEALSLSKKEKIELVRLASNICHGKINIIAGIINSVTDECIEFIKSVENIVDGFLCICPFYIKPSQEQIYSHFEALSRATNREIILYNNPSRVGTSITLETYKKLSYISNIVATKECSHDLSVFSAWRKEIGNDFKFLSGNDDTAFEAFSQGAYGAVSVTANVAPKLCVKMFEMFKQNNIKELERLRDILTPLHSMLFTEPTPAPVKYILSRNGLIKNELRRPLTSITKTLENKINLFIEKN